MNMPDDLRIKRPGDPLQINIHEEWELRYWTAKWGVTQQQLINAVRTVGTWTHDVQRFLGK
jgi:hypothetical protein